MTFCANCGGLWEEPGEFCRKCGASRLPGVVTAASVVRALTCGNTKYWECRDSQQRTQANIGGALSYLFGVVSGIAFLLLAPFRSPIGS